MERLDTLRALYLLAVDDLVERHPVQEGNRTFYEEWAAAAKLGFTTRRITTKGGFTDIPAGIPVLFAAESRFAVPMVTVWAPRADGAETRTMVSADAVIEVVSTVIGYRHRDGLVTLTESGT